MFVWLVGVLFLLGGASVKAQDLQALSGSEFYKVCNYLPSPSSDYPTKVLVVRLGDIITFASEDSTQVHIIQDVAVSESEGSSSINFFIKDHVKGRFKELTTVSLLPSEIERFNLKVDWAKMDKGRLILTESKTYTRCK